MARIEHIKHARKSPGTCGACGKAIEGRVADDQNHTITMGEAYKSFSPRYGSRRVRHESCPTWRPSEMTGSKMAEVMAAQEAFDEGSPYGSPDELAEAMNLVAEAARSVGEQYQESAQNIEDGFGHETFQSDELREKGQELESWADDIESTAELYIAAGGIEGTWPCGTCSESEDGDAHHEWSPSSDDPPVCKNEGCSADKDEHHDFEADESAFDDEADVVNNCPV